ncbi:hypothetical protein C0989_000588 [Termitomyces sp. Mn162]|nr:hypothetical protein C0989_000588 [Termitomyces sp. Mn162]
MGKIVLKSPSNQISTSTGIGRTVKNLIGSGNQTAHPTTGPESNRPFINGQSQNQEFGGVSELRSKFDSKDNIDSTWGPNRQVNHERSGKLGSDNSSGMHGRGETTIPGNKARGIGNKEYVSGSRASGIRQRGATEVDYNRGSLGPGVAGATTRTQHQRRASDFGGAGYGGGSGMTTHKITGHHVEHTMPIETATNESHQISPSIHGNVSQRDIEEVSREKEHDQNVDRIQDHAQPITDKNLKDEVHHDKIHPVANVRETPDEVSILYGQTHQHRDSREEGSHKRTVIDKGESVNEREIHHVHHVVQPVINKETIEQHRIHTIIPIHQITHEAPVVHKSQIHTPVSMEHFAQKGGQIAGGLTCDQIGSTVLRSGECTRDVDGEGENIARELTGSGLPGAKGHFDRHSTEGGPGSDKGRLEEPDQGALRSNTRASSMAAAGNREISHSTSKRGESAPMYGSQGHVMDSYAGRVNTGSNHTYTMTTNMGAGTSKICAVGSSSTTDHNNKPDSLSWHEGRHNS